MDHVMIYPNWYMEEIILWSIAQTAYSGQVLRTDFLVMLWKYIEPLHKQILTMSSSASNIGGGTSITKLIELLNNRDPDGKFLWAPR